MPAKPIDNALVIEAMNLVEEYGSGHLAHKSGGTKLPAKTIDDRYKAGCLRGLKPTYKKAVQRVTKRERLGRVHMVIPDTQQKPGVRNDHMEWIGNYAAEKKPDVIVHIGDHWDMPSLSSYDKGKLSFEGRRYVNDVKAGRVAMEKLLKPIDDYNRTCKKHEQYHPEMHFALGNHEIRISRAADDNPEYAGKLDLNDLGIAEYGWKVHDFLKPFKLDSIEYCHYFTSGVMGRPVSSAAALLRERQGSATMGHIQFFDQAVHKKTQKRAVFAGICYLHEEVYLGAQGNTQHPKILMKHEIDGEGCFDLMEVSLRFLEKAYS